MPRRPRIIVANIPLHVIQLQEVTNGNFAFGTSRFKQEISKMLERRVTPAKAGRPRKKSIPE